MDPLDQCWHWCSPAPAVCFSHSRREPQAAEATQAEVPATLASQCLRQGGKGCTRSCWFLHLFTVPSVSSTPTHNQIPVYLSQERFGKDIKEQRLRTESPHRSTSLRQSPTGSRVGWHSTRAVWSASTEGCTRHHHTWQSELGPETRPLYDSVSSCVKERHHCADQTELHLEWNECSPISRSLARGKCLENRGGSWCHGHTLPPLPPPLCATH